MTALRPGLAAIFAIGALSMPVSVHAQDASDLGHGQKPHILTVSGSGNVTTRPDAFTLSVTVETQAKAVEDARNDNAMKMTAVRQRLKDLHVSGLVLQTAGVNVYPVRVYNKNNTAVTITGYTVSNTLNVVVEHANPDQVAETASQVLDAALSTGANQSNGPSFYLSDRNSAFDQALTQAVKQARHTADTVAAAAGVHITGIQDIETEASAPPMVRPMGMMRMRAMDSAPAPTPMEAGETDVNASVTVHFRFE